MLAPTSYGAAGAVAPCPITVTGEERVRSIRDMPTSAGGFMRRSSLAVTIGAVLVSTTPSESATVRTYETTRIVERTTAGPTGQIRHVPAESTAEAILEIRRRSGLTWEELGDLFDVSRRSVHHWASGKPVSAKHDRMIRRILAIVRHLDRGNQTGARARLLALDDATGVSTFDLLKQGRFDEAAARLRVVSAPENRRLPLSRSAQDARRPQAPASLLEADQDRPDIPAKARAIRAARPSKNMV